MLVALPITEQSSEVDKVVIKATNRGKRRGETALATWKVWMPYHRIWIRCSKMDDSRVEKVATAVNAVFCVCAKAQSELFQIFRPRHLGGLLGEIEPKLGEIVCSYSTVDLEAIVDRLIKIHAEARDQLSQVEPELVRSYRKMQWQYLFLPKTTGWLQHETEASKKLARLQSRSLAVEICLNLPSNFVPQRVEEHDVFYIPMAVTHIKQEKGESSRFVLIDLTTGKMDAALTNLCELNEDFKTQLELSLHKGP